MEEILLGLLAKGGPLGTLIAMLISVLAIGVLARQKGWLSIGDKTRVVDHDDLSSINSKLGGIDKRLTDVEHDLKNRPTREEVHNLDISVTKLDGRMDGIERVTNATNHAVNRIEEHLLRASSVPKGK